MAEGGTGLAAGARVALASSGVTSAGAVGAVADDWLGLAHPTSDPITSSKAKIGAIFKGNT